MRPGTKRTLLGLFLLMSLAVLKYFPVMNLLTEVWYILIACFLVFIVLIKQVLDRGLHNDAFILYLILLCLSPILTAFTAYLHFGQPFYFGMLAQRNVILIGSSLILIYWFHRSAINMDDLEVVLVRIGWLTLIAYVFMTVFINPAHFTGYTGFVGGGVVEPLHFIFQTEFIVFAIIFYLVRGLLKGRTLDYVMLIPFVLYLVFVDGGRSLLLSLFLASIIIIFQLASLARVFVWMPIIAVVGVVVLLALLYLQGDYLNKLQEQFTDAISVVVTGKESRDASANARIDETAMAWKYIEKNWFFGNGFLSHQWEKGFKSKLGEFAPTDIGLIGAIYVFGIFGVLIYSCQFLFFRKWLKSMSRKSRTVLVEASKGFLIYFFIRSAATGEYIFHANVSVVFLTILFMAHKDTESNKVEVYSAPHVQRIAT